MRAARTRDLPGAAHRPASTIDVGPHPVDIGEGLDSFLAVRMRLE